MSLSNRHLIMLIDNINHCAFFRFLTRAQLNEQLILIKYSLNQNFNATAGCLSPKQSGWDDTCIIENQQISWVQQTRDIRKCTIIHLARLTVQVHKPAASTLLARKMGDELLR